MELPGAPLQSCWLGSAASGGQALPAPVLWTWDVAERKQVGEMEAPGRESEAVGPGSGSLSPPRVLSAPMSVGVNGSRYSCFAALDARLAAGGGDADPLGSEITEPANKSKTPRERCEGPGVGVRCRREGVVCSRGGE